MSVVYKYPLVMTHEIQMVAMPMCSRVLCTKMQRDTAHIWCLVDSWRPTRDYKFMILPTGQKLPDEWNLGYLDTFFEGDDAVWHLFEVLDL